MKEKGKMFESERGRRDSSVRVKSGSESRRLEKVVEEEIEGVGLRR